MATTRRAFTLIELMVVISIMVVVAFAVFGLTSALRGGDPLEQAAAKVKAMVQRGRSQSLARGSRFELLLDFSKNTLTALNRKPAAFFSFEGDVGAFAQMVSVNGSAMLSGAMDPVAAAGMKYNGEVLNVPTGGSASINIVDELSAQSSPGGVFVSCDFYPRAAASSALVSARANWSIRIEPVGSGAVKLEGHFQSTRVESLIPVPLWAWAHVEFLASPLAVILSVNGVPVAGKLTGNETPGDGFGGLIELGKDSDLLMDNLRIDGIEESIVVESGSAVLVPPGGDVLKCLAFKQYDLPAGAKEPGPEENVPLPLAPADPNFPDQLPPRRAMIFFDERGLLDLSRHGGPVTVQFASPGKEGNTQLMNVTISQSGIVTAQRVNGPRSEDSEIPESGAGQ